MIPAFNEEKRLPDFLTTARAYLASQFGENYEILVVDDGIQDNTAEVVRTLLGEEALVRLGRNMGKGAAVRAGMLKASGELVLFADADGATPIEEEQSLRAAIEKGADIAIGSRAKGGSSRLCLRTPAAEDAPMISLGMPTRKMRPHRLLMGRIFSTIVNRLLGLDVRDTQCGFKMFRSATVPAVFTHLATKRFGFDVEILVRAREMGYRLDEVGIRWEEKAGSKVRLFIDSFKMLGEVLAICVALRQRAAEEALSPVRQDLSRKVARLGLLLALLCGTGLGAPPANFTDKVIAKYNYLLVQHRYRDALSFVNVALAREPNNPSFLVAKANLALIQKEPNFAVTLCRQALKQNPKFEWAMSTLGKAYIDLDKPDAGLEWIDAAIKEGNNPILLIERAELLLNMKRYEEAEPAFEQAMKANPNNVDIMVDRAWNLRQLHFDRAEERLLIQAVRKFPQDRRALMAYTNHLKDRRHYPLCLLFLEKSNPATNPRYNLGFFSRTGMKGYSLSPIGIPFTLSLFNEVGVEPTNLENLTRSLRQQGIDPLADGALLPTPYLVPRNLMKFDFSIFAPLIPIIRISFVDDRKFNRQDGFFERRSDLLTLSLETTFLWNGVGDVTLLPFFRTSFQGGDSLDIRTGNHAEFSINKFTLGMLAYLQPRIGGPLYELEVAHSRGDVSDSYLRLAGQIPVSDLVRLSAELNYIWGSEYRFTADFSRFSLRVGTEVGYRDGIRGRAELRAAVRKDVLQTGPEYTYTFLTPHVGGIIPLHRRWSLEADLGLIRNNRFSQYDGTSAEFSVAHRFFPTFERKMTDATFKYESPIELKLGVQVNSFSNFPTGAVAPVGVVGSINLFW